MFDTPSHKSVDMNSAATDHQKKSGVFAAGKNDYLIDPSRLTNIVGSGGPVVG